MRLSVSSDVQTTNLLSYILIISFNVFQNAVPLKGNEVNLTLGGIDLNNSGRLACFLPTILHYYHSQNREVSLSLVTCVVEFCSVIVKADKKLLTVQFPDGHDGRAFTLKVLKSSPLM